MRLEIECHFEIRTVSDDVAGIASSDADLAHAIPVKQIRLEEAPPKISRAQASRR